MNFFFFRFDTEDAKKKNCIRNIFFFSGRLLFKSNIEHFCLHFGNLFNILGLQYFLVTIICNLFEVFTGFLNVTVNVSTGFNVHFFPIAGKPLESSSSFHGATCIPLTAAICHPGSTPCFLPTPETLLTYKFSCSMPQQFSCSVESSLLNTMQTKFLTKNKQFLWAFIM